MTPGAAAAAAAAKSDSRSGGHVDAANAVYPAARRPPRRRARVLRGKRACSRTPLPTRLNNGLLTELRRAVVGRRLESGMVGKARCRCWRGSEQLNNCAVCAAKESLRDLQRGHPLSPEGQVNPLSCFSRSVDYRRRRGTRGRRGMESRRRQWAAGNQRVDRGGGRPAGDGWHGDNATRGPSAAGGGGRPRTAVGGGRVDGCRVMGGAAGGRHRQKSRVVG